MQKHTVTAGPYAAASANNISLSQTGASGALSLNGTTKGVLDQPRRVLFTDSGDNTSVSYVLTGTTWGNSAVTETVAGTNGSTAYTNTDFLTVTAIAIAGASAAPTALTVGTNTVAGTAWVRLDGWANAASVNVQTKVTGTINYDIQCTMDDPNGSRGQGTNITGPIGTGTVTIPNVVWDATLPSVTGATAGTSFNMAYTPVYVRALINSWSTTGNMTMYVMQQGVVSA